MNEIWRPTGALCREDQTGVDPSDDFGAQSPTSAVHSRGKDKRSRNKGMAHGMHRTTLKGRGVSALAMFMASARWGSDLREKSEYEKVVNERKNGGKGRWWRC